MGLKGASAKLCVVLALCATASSTYAGDGKLLGAGGLISLEGSAGGGISPWAVIAGYNEADQWSALAASSRVATDDYQLQTNSVAIGAYNRVEMSLTRQTFVIPGARLGQDIVGAKVRLALSAIMRNRCRISGRYPVRGSTRRAPAQLPKPAA